MPPNKKRKLTTPTTTITDDLNTSKPTAIFQPTGPRHWTLSVALPGSIISNAKSHDAKTYLAGTLARSLAVFSVDEIVIFNDGTEGAEATRPVSPDAYTAFSHPSHFLSHVLSYLETPAHLRKCLFGMHPNLRTAGALPSLDMPHHLRRDEEGEFREGVGVGSGDGGSWVDVGLPEQCWVQGVDVPVDARVTVRMEGNEVVGPDVPREEKGYYWGYNVRQCGCLSAVLTECPWDGGYDLSIGTSERGERLSEVVKRDVPEWRHLLLVFGGVAGLESAVVNDPELEAMGIGKGNVGELFDYWVNVLPGQGSRTIRTEEAVWLGLMGTRGLVEGK